VGQLSEAELSGAGQTFPPQSVRRLFANQLHLATLANGRIARNGAAIALT
jgi:hypothetical protein